MLRADMDALPVQEATGLPYASNVTGTYFAPVIHPTIETGVETLAVAALAWLGEAVTGKK